MAKAPLGSGERFKALKSKLTKQGAKNPEALTAWIGNRKHGKTKMNAMATAGKKRKNSGRRKA